VAFFLADRRPSVRSSDDFRGDSAIDRGQIGRVQERRVGGRVKNRRIAVKTENMASETKAGV
jgi:hypothetical protein